MDLRRKLSTPEIVGDFLQELTDRTDPEQHPNVRFENIDLSQNNIPLEDFETFFGVLSSCGAQVERLKLFGCPTLDDAVAELIAGWISGLRDGAVPTELHLSDCAISTNGFRALMDALENNEHVPAVDKHHGCKVPMYCRLENNYINEGVMHEKADAGAIILFDKASKGKGKQSTRNADRSGAKLKLVGRTFQQKTGPPPAPEDAPPPKKVEEPWKGNAKGKGEGGGAGGSGKGLRDGKSDVAPWRISSNSWERTVSWERTSSWDRTSSWERKSESGWDRDRRGDRGENQAGDRGQTWRSEDRRHASGEAWSLWSSRTGRDATDNSRRNNGSSLRPGSAALAALPSSARAQPYRNGAGGQQPVSAYGEPRGARPNVAVERSRSPVRKPAAKTGGESLPEPWQKHFSDEYSLHYYWNSKTGESRWEPPI